MYGLLLESMREAFIAKYGVSVWNQIRNATNVSHHGFASHDCYGDDLFTRLATAASDVTGTPYDDVMESLGRSFVRTVGCYGYADTLRAMGRNLSDFLDGLDNLHEYLRPNYPRMRAPSFVCERETSDGLRLRYRSRRGGLTHYVIGQLKEIAVVFFDKYIDIDVISVTQSGPVVDVILQLHFKTDSPGDQRAKPRLADCPLGMITQEQLRSLLPFHVRFGRDMVITSVGCSIEWVLSDTVGQLLGSCFTLARPPIEFRFSEMLAYKNNVFQLTSVSVVSSVTYKFDTSEDNLTEDGSDYNEEVEQTRLHLKGQMLHLAATQEIIFIASPAVQNLDQIQALGLYIHDLSLHDISRDIIIAGSHRPKSIKSALKMERQKRQKMEQTLRMLDAEIRKGDLLLHRMIPREVADKLRRGETALSTCETFDEVTILFSDVIGFSTICSRIPPMEIVKLLNRIFTNYDEVTEKHPVYKVETTGDAYMLVSGAPTRTKAHAQHISNIAFELRQRAEELLIPETGDRIQIRIGIHSGTVVGGIIGMRMPRYCFFGDTVNTASRMKSNCEPMKIHISQTTRRYLKRLPFTIVSRGTIVVKGKGSMKTYYLASRGAARGGGLDPVSGSRSLCNVTLKAVPSSLSLPTDLWRWRSRTLSVAEDTIVPLLTSEFDLSPDDESVLSTRSRHFCIDAAHWLARKCRQSCTIL